MKQNELLSRQYLFSSVIFWLCMVNTVIISASSVLVSFYNCITISKLNKITLCAAVYSYKSLRNNPKWNSTMITMPHSWHWKSRIIKQYFNISSLVLCFIHLMFMILKLILSKGHLMLKINVHSKHETRLFIIVILQIRQQKWIVNSIKATNINSETNTKLRKEKELKRKLTMGSNSPSITTWRDRQTDRKADSNTCIWW